jgi:hypothetical protein
MKNSRGGDATEVSLLCKMQRKCNFKKEAWGLVVFYASFSWPWPANNTLYLKHAKGATWLSIFMDLHMHHA